MSVPAQSAGCPPGTVCYSQTAQLLQQASQAQYRADLEQQTRQQVERIHTRMTTQHANLLKQHRTHNDRYNQLHKAWVQAEMVRKDSENQLQQATQVRQTLEMSIDQQKDLITRMTRHFQHLLDTTKILARQLYLQQIDQSHMSAKQKEEAKQVDITAVFVEKERLQAECNHLQMEIKRSNEERRSRSKQ